jgi:hypothetical protein
MSDSEDDIDDNVVHLVRKYGKARKSSSENKTPQSKTIAPMNEGSGVFINAENITLSNVNIGGNTPSEEQKEVKPPEVKPIEEMKKEEKKAFDKGQWDGIERRTRNSIKEDEAFKRLERRRKQDTENIITYYVMLGLLFIALLALVLAPIINLIIGN